MIAGMRERVSDYISVPPTPDVDRTIGVKDGQDGVRVTPHKASSLADSASYVQEPILFRNKVIKDNTSLQNNQSKPGKAKQNRNDTETDNTIDQRGVGVVSKPAVLKEEKDPNESIKNYIEQRGNKVCSRFLRLGNKPVNLYEEQDMTTYSASIASQLHGPKYFGRKGIGSIQNQN